MKFSTTFVTSVVVSMLFPAFLMVEPQTNPSNNSELRERKHKSDANIVPPRPTYAPDPEYSERARKAGLQGSCELSLIIGSDGLVQDVRVTKSLGMGLDENSVNAVRSWKFEPARKNGVPVAAQITVEVSFRLGDSKRDVEEILGKLPTVIPPPVVMRVEECPSPEPAHERQKTEAEVVVAAVELEGAEQVSASDQRQIAEDIKQRKYTGGVEAATNEIADRVKAAWQDRGYFKANVSADSNVLSSSPVTQRIEVSLHIDEGRQYKLGGITFKNNRAIRNEKLLRGLFPINDGDIFNRDQIAAGLAALRKAYGEYGYVNFTSVPDTHFDDENGLVYLEIDCDEGKQFYISSVTLIGSNQEDLVSAATDLPFKPGDIFNGRLIELFQHKDAALLRPEDPNREAKFFDNEAGTIALTFDLRRCQVQKSF